MWLTVLQSGQQISPVNSGIEGSEIVSGFGGRPWARWVLSENLSRLPTHRNSRIIELKRIAHPYTSLIEPIVYITIHHDDFLLYKN